eukprot:13380823-Ditylum_brightwellii.AAC.1
MHPLEVDPGVMRSLAGPARPQVACAARNSRSATVASTATCGCWLLICGGPRYVGPTEGAPLEATSS